MCSVRPRRSKLLLATLLLTLFVTAVLTTSRLCLQNALRPRVSAHRIPRSGARSRAGVAFVTSVQVVGMSRPHFTGTLLESLRSIGVGDRNGTTGVMLLSSRG